MGQVIKRWQVGWLVTTVVFLALTWSGVGHGGEIMPIAPGYPEEFSYIGKIDAISSKSIVIDDRTYILTKETRFHVPEGQTSSSAFTVGNKVGVVADDSRHLHSLWLFPTTLNDAGVHHGLKMDRGKKNRPTGQLRQQNGVWVY